MKIFVFDLGGTLMEYTDMPYSWVDYYKTGFEAVAKQQGFNVSVQDIEKSVEILKNFNPRVNYREEEYSPEYIFGKALAHWQGDVSIIDSVKVFYDGLNLKAQIYPDVIPALSKLRKMGHCIATLTDLPTAMPNDFFRNSINKLLEYFDLYVSSLSCGFRKPNPKGLELIANHFNIPVTELVFIGDEEKDKKTADNAGCKFIRINRKENQAECISNLEQVFDRV